MVKHPTKINVVRTQANNVVIRYLYSGEELCISANDFVRGVDDGTFELQNFVEPPTAFDYYIQEVSGWPEEQSQLSLPSISSLKMPSLIGIEA